jgi:hypothetical protein
MQVIWYINLMSCRKFLKFRCLSRAMQWIPKKWFAKIFDCEQNILTSSNTWAFDCVANYVSTRFQNINYMCIIIYIWHFLFNVGVPFTKGSIKTKVNTFIWGYHKVKSSSKQLDIQFMTLGCQLTTLTQKRFFIPF